MKRLILIRHAKSSWDSPSDDHARPLNHRGQKACAALGIWLRKEGHLPQSVFSSDAARTRETTERITAAAGITPDITYSGSLYHASAQTLMAGLRRGQGDVLALIAHNPGIAAFADALVHERPPHHRFFDYPTGATLVCDLPIKKWADASLASAHVIDFIVPRDLGPLDEV